MLRPRFRLQTLLLLPVCAAAFYVGWTMHLRQMENEHIRQQASVSQRHDEMQKVETIQRAVSRARLQNAAQAMEINQHRELMNRYLDNPIKARMLPGGGF